MLRIQIINLPQGHLHVKTGNCTLIGSISLVYPSGAVIPKTVLKDHTGANTDSHLDSTFNASHAVIKQAQNGRRFFDLRRWRHSCRSDLTIAPV